MASPSVLYAPTQENYQELQQVFEFLNPRLFDGQVEPVLFTLQRKKRSLGYASRHRFVDSQTGSMVDELAVNPSYWACRTIKQTLSTIAHEMTHLWQAAHGKPGRAGYHNIEWAEKMESIGLMPSHTGLPGGRRTGEQMTHYIIEGGPFDVACDELLANGFELSWLDMHPARPPGSMVQAPVPAGAQLGYAPGHEPDLEEMDGPDDGNGEPAEPAAIMKPLGAGVQQLMQPSAEGKPTRIKYVCPRCQLAAMAKPGALLFCGGKLQKRRAGDEWIKHDVVAMATPQGDGLDGDDHVE